jgi:HTH-type transcriptional regulator/antitoxin HigA
MHAELDTPEGDRLDILATLVEAYEAKHYPMVGPDPIAVILHRMEALSMTRKDLEPLLGTRRRVAEVLARKRPLSLPMIRKIAKAMRIPADLLIQPYATATSRATF